MATAEETEDDAELTEDQIATANELDDQFRFSVVTTAADDADVLVALSKHDQSPEDAAEAVEEAVFVRTADAGIAPHDEATGKCALFKVY